MTRPAYIQTILTRTSRPRIEDQSSSCPHSLRTQSCAADLPFAHRRLGSSPCRTRRTSDGNAAVRQVRLTHPLICPCSPRRVSEQGPLPLGGNGVLIGRNPSAKCFRRAPILLYFPCSPSVTRFGAYPAPCGTARLCFAWARTAARQCTKRFWPMRPAGFGFQKIFVQRTQKDFPNLPKKRRLALGAGHTRVASRKSVPRVIRANTTKEK